MVKDPLEIMDEDDEDDPTSDFVNIKKGNANASENDSENPDKSDDAGKVGATRSRGNLIFLHGLKITICIIGAILKKQTCSLALVKDYHSLKAYTI